MAGSCSTNSTWVFKHTHTHSTLTAQPNTNKSTSQPMNILTNKQQIIQSLGCQDNWQASCYDTNLSGHGLCTFIDDFIINIARHQHSFLMFTLTTSTLWWQHPFWWIRGSRSGSPVSSTGTTHSKLRAASFPRQRLIGVGSSSWQLPVIIVIKVYSVTAICKKVKRKLKGKKSSSFFYKQLVVSANHDRSINSADFTYKEEQKTWRVTEDGD